MTTQPNEPRNPYLSHANIRHYRKTGGEVIAGPKKPKRTVYRRYQPKFERVTWYVSALDAVSVHGHARLFGYFRRERLWVLLETTGATLQSKIDNRQNDRTGLDVYWKLSADMRSHLTRLAAATSNAITHDFVKACFTIMDRINRVKTNTGGLSL